LRHGLRNTPNGRISIGLAEGGGEVVIYVKDNGAGLPDGFDLDADSGFGLRIVRGLVEEELGGRLEIEAGDGLLVRFRFPKL
jgi:two-component sensor histidine kinase